MLKYIYFIGLFMVSFLLFVSSKEQESNTCSLESYGKIEAIDQRLIIVTDKNEQLVPHSVQSGVLLTPHPKVVICYSIDSSRFSDKDSIPVNIESVTYLK